MKNKLIVFLILLFGSIAAFSQAPLNFSARLNITSVTGSDPYTLVGVIQDDLGLWSAADLNTTADSIYHLEGSDLLIYRITTISSAIGNNFTIIVDDIMNSGILPSTGTEWCAVEFTTNYQYPMEVGNLATNFKGAINNRFKQRLDVQLALASEDAAMYSTLDTTAFSPSSPAPTTKDFAFWQNRGQILEKTTYWNRRSSKNGELVNTANRVVVSYGALGVTDYNLLLGNRFYTSANGDITITASNEATQETVDAFVFEVFNNTEDAITATFEDGLFIDFVGDTIANQTIGAFATRVFTFHILKSTSNYLVSSDDLTGTPTVFVPTDGIYTPTIDTFATDTVITIFPHYYEIGDSIITVTGKFLVNSTAGTVATSVQISLPPGGTSNFTSLDNDVNGQVFAATRGTPFTNYYGYAFANSATDKIEVSFKSDEDILTDQYVEYIIKYVKK